MPTLLLGIDLGTSYFKVGLFDASGALHGLGRIAVDAKSPAPGRIELPVPEFWDRLRRGLESALHQAKAKVDQIAGVSYSSQANTFVLIDAAQTPLTPLIFWADQRARPLDPCLVEFGQSSFHGATTGMSGMVPELMSAKCAWLRRHDPARWSRVRHILTVSDYLTFALTGERCSDASTAALTGLYSLPKREWWPEALALFEIDADHLPTPLIPGTPCGRTHAQATRLLGLPTGIPFAVGALDHHAAALGAGLGESSDASLSAGTVLAALVLTECVTPAPGCKHGPHTDGRRYYRLAFDPRGAGQLEEYQQRHAPGLEISALLERAEGAARAPEHPPAEHGPAVLALLLAMARTQKALLDQASGGAVIRRITATGGMARSAFWLQMTADIVGLPVAAGTSPERACLGAAIFAARAAGVWPDEKTASARMVMPPRLFVPGVSVDRPESTKEIL